jgi:ankyrin repeat protein
MAAAPLTTFAKEANSENLAYGAKSENMAQVTSLLDAGANPNAFETRRTLVRADAKDRDKITARTTALMQAVLWGELEIAQLLLDRVADPDLRHSQDDCIRSVARIIPCPARIIPAAAMSTNVRQCPDNPSGLDTGWTAFHAACLNNQPDCVEILVQAGCNVAATWDSAESRMSEGLLTGKQVAKYCICKWPSKWPSKWPRGGLRAAGGAREEGRETGAARGRGLRCR